MRAEHWWYEIPLRLRSLFRRQRVEQELDEELQDHLERQTQQNLEQGMTPEEARRRALRAMDGLTQRKEECRDMRKVNVIEDAVQDVRYGLRMLRKSPGFTTVAVLTLALAIGANAVVFGVVNAAILRPLDVPRAESLFGLQRGKSRAPAQSYPDYLDLRARNNSFEDLAGYNITMAAFDTGDRPTRAWVYEVTGNYFDVLGIRPYLGRFFSSADEHGPNSAPYVVLTYGFWHTHFQDDAGVVGRVVQINKHAFTILGVAPPKFHGTLLFLFPDFLVPVVNREQIEGPSALGTNVLNTRGTRSIFMVMGHLKAGVTEAQAVADLNAVGAYLEATYPDVDGDMKFTLGRPGLYGDFLGRPVRAFVTGLMTLAALVLIAACANLGSLFAAKATERSREVALRLALGAGRGRILRQLFTESLLISLMGGAAGLAGSVALLKRLSVWQPIPRFPINVPVAPDASVYLAALFLAVVSGILFGLAPARQLRRTDPYQVVKAGAMGAPGRRFTVRDGLLAVQIAICAVLVTSSLVAVRGMARSMASDFGFEPRSAMLLNTDLMMSGYRGEATAAMQRRMIEGMEAIPGVQAAGMIDRVPLSGNFTGTNIFRDNATDLRPASAAFACWVYDISPEYLAAAKTRLLAGRSFTLHDQAGAPRVAIVNREFAKRLFGSVAGAVGAHFKRRDGTRIEVVGVVEDGKYAFLTEEREATLFQPLLQVPSSDTWIVVRSNRDPQQLAADIRQVVRKLDASTPIYLQTWSKELDLALFGSMVATIALGVLGMMGAMLSLTGIFGMAAYSVSRRLREVGIRMALGAQRKQVLQAVLARPVKLLAFGSAAGLGLGILATRVLALIVYQATPRDPLVLAGVVLAMLAVGIAATWIPAQRALAVDPLRLLRED